ncbi:16S rRNA (cytosine(1402)-N(4))-methyltransferase RsmH [Helicobacter baculiformis]|uniref:Ribosomal RNA small subunit methyltransferase H n=1 Tax=Helicobacter baculiformis TaxID=427351 RepID=A0ABV7ZIJ5_9HELI|nr:16S rRNA (cytosine(1402)-N(4))-methyltransferase RsmH [Helicobacter baculiformis]
MHQSVLLQEVIDAFAPLAHIKDPLLIDCTLGLGGHTLALLQTYPHLRVIGIDRDEEALSLAQQRLADYTPRFTYRYGAYQDIIAELLQEGVWADCDGVLADLGVSSLQLDSNARGFGFNAPTLDMRMDTNASLSAYKVINHYSPYELERVLERGEVRGAKKIASLIVQRRHQRLFEEAKDLASFLGAHTKRHKHHPATLVFQAVRMEVNDEMGNLRALLDHAKELKHALLAIISFHSLEDRQVKHAFKEFALDDGLILTKKPITPGALELQQNPRARSAKMRIFHFRGCPCHTHLL